MISTLFENNKFTCKEGSIKLGRVDDVTITGNVFKNFEVEAVRVEGGYNAGTFNIKDNQFL